MTCERKHRLLEESDAASLRLSEVVATYGAMTGAQAIERERLQRRAEEARLLSVEAMAELQTHRLLHGC
jgi:hypothetical protein